jgi:hypothetical protein
MEPCWNWKFCGNTPDNTKDRIKSVKFTLKINDVVQVSSNPVIYFLPAKTEHMAFQTVLVTIAKEQKWSKHYLDNFLHVSKGANFTGDECTSFVVSFTLNTYEEIVLLTLDFDFPADERAWKTAVESKITEQAKQIDRMGKQIQDLHLLISDLYEEHENRIDGDSEADEIVNETIQLLKKRKVNDKPV